MTEKGLSETIVLTQNGSFEHDDGILKQYFMMKNGTPGDRWTVTFDKKDHDKVVAKLRTIHERGEFDEEFTSVVSYYDSEEHEDRAVMMTWLGGRVMAATDRRYLYIVSCADRESRTLAERIYRTVTDMVTREKKAKISLICYSNGYYLSDVDIMPVEDIGVELNYNDDFAEAASRIDSFIDDDRSGLVILHGEQGTGKTMYIRSLITNHPDKRFIFVTNTMAERLSDPGFIDFLMKNMTDTVLVMEDCEQLLQKRDMQKGNTSGISTILNVTDGLLGDYSKLKMICTFNTDMSNIDAALLRKGRLRMKYRFDKLPAYKAYNIIERLHPGRFAQSSVPMMSLSDIYNMDEGANGGEQKSKKIGF